MALKALLLKRQIDEKKNRMAALSAKTMELDTREQELEAALAEASTEAELRSVQELVDAFSTEQEEHRAAVHALEQEIAAGEEELRTLEAKTPPPLSPTPAPLPAGGDERRKDDVSMSKRMTRAFGNMTMEQRAAFIQREEVQDFLTRFREMFKGGQKRSVSGAELSIPTSVLELLQQNIEDYSKLLRHVRFIAVAGRSRQPIMGAIPEAVWTEACAALNELDFTFDDVEVDGYKVGGYVAICNSLLEDSDIALLSELIAGMGGAIGIALDKAIFVRLGPWHNSGFPAARAADFHHFPLPKRGPFIQHLFQPAIRYPHGLINKAPKLQSIPDRRPVRQALRRLPGYQLCHSFHGVTSLKSPPAP